MGPSRKTSPPQTPFPDRGLWVKQATGKGEQDPAKAMTADLAGAHQKTVGVDNIYDTKGFVAEMRRIDVTPHVAQNTNRPGG